MDNNETEMKNINLIPLHSLDGGITVSAISPKLWLIGIPIGIIAILKFFNPIILMMLVLGVIQVISQFKNPNKSYYDVKPLTRLEFTLASNHFTYLLK